MKIHINVLSNLSWYLINKWINYWRFLICFIYFGFNSHPLTKKKKHMFFVLCVVFIIFAIIQFIIAVYYIYFVLCLGKVSIVTIVDIHIFVSCYYDWDWWVLRFSFILNQLRNWKLFQYLGYCDFMLRDWDFFVSGVYYFNQQCFYYYFCSITCLISFLYSQNCVQISELPVCVFYFFYFKFRFRGDF